ncbi:BREX system serine/threonine kinase PglW [Streptomyces sp. S1A1-8]|uniref:BREX system serine/threonine kinase PglW n=1 Tax=unclassified Streptomyces TaxID=2593676 RepID=UPI0011635C6E|nr:MULTISPECIES: BREX system serine/threonine kinase PglW [unclassified Streptomyces]QDN97731.1 BREX system serine/threonine kinase PglW [Streptomyces sp. RLB1-9]QDO19436.1 BREX system serine/threonine kinase PglW [Streptomyces sp. S1A1-8]QDO29562.1 BREX system serine/threonine kinase PglW [Streptomyces sp. S1A1-3]
MTAAGTPSAPKPGPPPRKQQRWFQPRRSAHTWEQDGLDHIRQLMPANEPYRAWATFSFTAASGRTNECDLFIAVPGGVYLLELKGHPGRVVNHGDTWQFHADRVRTLKNPLHLTDLKCKELKGQLERAARANHIDPRRIPFIKPAVFLHGAGLISGLDEFQRLNVYGRNDGASGLDKVWDDLLGKPPERESWRITPNTAQLLEQLMQKIGISHSTAHLRFGDDWKLEPRALDAGPGWEDRLAARDDGLVQEEGRVRIYLVEQMATDEARQAADRAARREYQVLQGITHRGVAQAVQIREHQGGPAILFRHRHSDLRLDAYLDAYGGRLTPETRLDLVRQLAEALRYAHNRSLYHRALAARSVYVSAKEDGSEPVVRIADWQTAARDFDTSSMRSIGDTPLDPNLIEDAAQVFLAPETDQEFADPVDLDMFGLGALAYLLLTGERPAAQRSALIERLSTEGGLHPYAVADGLSDKLDDLVFHATRAEVNDRLPSAERFLDLLDEAEQETAVPEQSEATEMDPLTALPGQSLDGVWSVKRVLGTGATARALLVERVIEDLEGPAGEQVVEERVFKVALDRDKDARLYAEAQALKTVGGGRIIRLLDEPREIAGHAVLELEYAGESSLGARLRGEGRLTYDQLERYGNDLFIALDQLAAKGTRHRDIKPDNLGLHKRSDGSWQLMLFDFSLADASERDISAGTRGYLDPFLGSARRSLYDDHAERYAAAVTLHEMASGERPVWGDGQTDPRMSDEAELYVAAELFEPGLRDGLTAFFQRALHRDVDRRFDTFQQMEDAWRHIFRTADSTKPPTTQATVGAAAATTEEARETAAAAADLTTALDAAGLSLRAVSVAGGLGAGTVGELLDIPPHTISRARGAGALVRRELNRRHKQWTAMLRRPAIEAEPRPSPPAVHPAPGDAEDLEGEAQRIARESVDSLAARLTPAPARKGNLRPDVVRLALGLPQPREEGDALSPLGPWPPQTVIAKHLGSSQPTVSRHHVAAIEEWSATAWLTAVRDELVQILTQSGRVLTAQEAAAELRIRHGAGTDTAERTLAKALAVVRAAADAEVLQRGADADDEPRLAVLRRGQRVLLALESLPGTDDPTPQELAGYAAALGTAADRLAAEDPLPGRGTVVRTLREVPAPEGMTPLADTRLVALAAAVAQDAAASPRLELYPTALGLARALRISQAAAGVRRETGVSVTELLSRVHARFPSLAIAAAPTHIEVEDALTEAGFPLEYDPVRKRFFPPAVEGARWTSSTYTRTSVLVAEAQAAAAAGRDPQAVVRVKLATAAQRGGFLALTLKGVDLPGTAEALTAEFGVVPVDLNAEFLTVFRALADELRTDWAKVLRADATFTESGELKPGLRSYAQRVTARLADRLREVAEASGPRTVLFVHNSGLIARYFDGGGHDLLVSLQQSARRPAEVPHGLWWLCPMEDPKQTPSLDGRTVEVVDRATEWAVLDSLFLKELRTTDIEGQ